jgi:hypothetical protein
MPIETFTNDQLLLIKESDITQYYTNFKNVFSKLLANNLPLHSEFDHKIELNGDILSKLPKDPFNLVPRIKFIDSTEERIVQ